MKYDPKNLSVLSYANGFTLWHYTTSDYVVTNFAYFDPASDMLRVGDMILVNTNTDSGRVSADIVLVVDNVIGVTVRSITNSD